MSARPCVPPADAPVCAEAKDVWAEPGNTVTARCRVNASPEDSISFSWVWVTNSYTRRVIPSHITSEGSASMVEFTVPRDNITELGSNNRMGALQCWAENSVGRQDTPCIVAVRKPGERVLLSVDACRFQCFYVE